MHREQRKQQEILDMAAEVERISQQHEQERAKLGLIMQVEQARQHKSLAEKREMRRRKRCLTHCEFSEFSMIRSTDR